MNTFFKVFFGCLLALAVFSIIGLIVLVGIASSFSDTEKVEVRQKTVLMIDLAEPVSDQGREENLSPFSMDLETYPGLFDIVSSVYHAANDSLVKCIYLKCRGNGMGMAASQELSAALDSFRAKGKEVVAFTDVLPQRAYEVAHHASRLYVQPGGIVEWVGYFAEVMFFKNLLDRIKVEPEIFYAGQFKSATEPFRYTRMSDANRLQYKVFLKSVQNEMLVSVAGKRQLDTNRLNVLANTLAVRTAEQAHAEGMIDGVLYHDQVMDTIRRIAGLSAKEEISFMGIKDYREAMPAEFSGEKVAIVFAEGSIVDGKGEEGEIGSDTYRKLISKLRNDDKIKAVVLRINSPGGSAIASEVILRELQLLKKEKPLVVSMGNYAASGGYYIACAADSIFTLPNTLTGSIGVFSIMVNAGQMFHEKLGIDFDGVGTNTYSDFGNVARPMSPIEKMVAQRDVDSIYSTFKSHVVVGRKLKSSFVDSIAQGRIWSGNDACVIKLTDRVGGLKEALECAARMANLKKYSPRKYPLQKSLLERIFGITEGEEDASAKMIEKELGTQQASWFRQYKALNKMINQPQTRLPFQLQLY